MTRFIACLLFLLLASPAVTMAAAKKEDTQVCNISGFVMNVERVERSAWNDGAPSVFSTVETHVTLSVTDRKAHDNKPGDTPCKQAAADKSRVYKMCSPTPVKAGDRITATEGTDVNLPHSLECLFDVTVNQ